MLNNKNTRKFFLIAISAPLIEVPCSWFQELKWKFDHLFNIWDKTGLKDNIISIGLIELLASLYSGVLRKRQEFRKLIYEKDNGLTSSQKLKV